MLRHTAEIDLVMGGFQSDVEVLALIADIFLLKWENTASRKRHTTFDRNVILGEAARDAQAMTTSATSAAGTLPLVPAGSCGGSNRDLE